MDGTVARKLSVIKPLGSDTKFGVNSPDEYLVAFNLYQENEETEQNLAKAPATVRDLFAKYGVKYNYPYHVFMQNLFTTVPLLEELELNGYHGTETVKVNRLGKSCPLADTGAFKHLDKGSTCMYNP